MKLSRTLREHCGSLPVRATKGHASPRQSSWQCIHLSRASVSPALRVGDSSWHSEKIVKKSRIVLSSVIIFIIFAVVVFNIVWWTVFNRVGLSYLDRHVFRTERHLLFL